MFALSLCQTVCLHGKCHAFGLISLAARKKGFAPLPHVFAHWHIFPSIALCHSIKFQMHLSIWVPSDVCGGAFFFVEYTPHTHTHMQRELDPGAAPICAFISVLSTLPFLSCFLSLSFSHCHRICSIFLFQLFFSGLQARGKKSRRKRMTKTRRKEAGRFGVRL